MKLKLKNILMGISIIAIILYLRGLPTFCEWREIKNCKAKSDPLHGMICKSKFLHAIHPTPGNPGQCVCECRTNIFHASG